MYLPRQLLNVLTMACLSAMMWQHCAIAELASNTDNNAISNLYDNLLQREYAGPVVFPNHQVERKAQRSPSLRLRFGRRNDPDMLPAAEKRWFGDVNQKPIRSPSLRLRFGRRSDPSMPLHSQLDALMNDLAAVRNDAGTAAAVGAGANVAADIVDDMSGLTADDYADAAAAAAAAAAAYENAYERVVRKPQRLRWGRSVPLMQSASTIDAELEHAREEQQQRQRTDDFLNSLLTSEKLRNMLLSLRQYDAEPLAAIADADAVAGAGAELGDDEFQREVRKPAPLRLRWGRSTGGRSQTELAGVEAPKQKKAVAQNAVHEDKSINALASNGQQTTAVQQTKN